MELMKQRYRLIRRETGVYYSFDRITNQRLSLDTKDEQTAERLIAAKNESGQQQAAVNLQIAKAYISASDPLMAQRSWQTVLNNIIATKTGETKARWERAAQDEAFDLIRELPLLETHADHFLRVLQMGTVSSNAFLRRLHNFALDMNWLLAPVLPRKQWPAVRHKKKRAVTWEEHLKIIDGELNPERAAFYDLVWHVGGSQSDIANLQAEDIDWQNRCIVFQRQKIRHRRKPPVRISFGSYVAAILKKLPHRGPLFPNHSKLSAGHRATEFKRLLKRLRMSTDITLHSYRYAWAQRAKKANYPQRYAMESLGHNSRAMHQEYAADATIQLPALEDYERKIVAMPAQVA